MVQVVNHGGRNVWVGAAHPNADHPEPPQLRVSAGGQFAAVRLQFAIKKGATVTSSNVELYAKGDIPAQTITLRRFADAFREDDTWETLPGVTGAAASVTIPAMNDGDLIQVPVNGHVQTIVSGARNYGWRVETDDASGTTQFYSLNSGKNQPRLVTNYAEKPGVATDIRPSDGSRVSDSAPTITYSYADVTGEGLAAQWIQCDPAGNWDAPAFDSGWSDTTVPEFDLSTSTFTPMTDLQTMQRRINIRGNDGGESGWSAAGEWTYEANLDITLSSPSVTTPSVFEPTPEILFQTSKPCGAYRVVIARTDDHTHRLYDSGWKPGNGLTTIGHDIPKKWRGNRILRDDTQYTLIVHARGQEHDREATPGHPIDAKVVLDFTADTDAAVAPVTSLTAEQDGTTPWVVLTWTRDSAPDEYVVRMDGRVVESGIDPAGVLVSGTTYQWRYHGASANDPHEFSVRAVVNRRQSPSGPTATVTTAPQGVWLIDYERDKSFVLTGRGADDWKMTDQVGVYTRLDGSQMQVHTGMSGLGDHFEGTMGPRPGPGRTVAQLEADLWAIKEQPERQLQLIFGDMSIPVKVRNLFSSVAPNSLPGAPRRRVAFDWFQDGDLPFDVRL